MNEKIALHGDDTVQESIKKSANIVEKDKPEIRPKTGLLRAGTTREQNSTMLKSSTNLNKDKAATPSLKKT